jgi:PIN domain nuclease of toxin-antitoxin system
VKLLLDTHALLWWLADEQLGARAFRAVEDPGNLVAVSAASVWEISIKRAQGKLRAEGDLIAAIEESGFEPLPVSFRDADHAGALPPHHRDPFDRMLIAQAQLQDLTIVTRDRRFSAYDVETLGC